MAKIGKLTVSTALIAAAVLFMVWWTSKKGE